MHNRYQSWEPSSGRRSKLATVCFSKEKLMDTRILLLALLVGVCLTACPGAGRAEESEGAAAYYNLGLVLHAKGDLAGAIKAYEKAIELNPKDAGSYNGLVFLYIDAADFDSARRVVARARKAGVEDKLLPSLVRKLREASERD